MYQGKLKRFPDPVDINELKDQIKGLLKKGLTPNIIAYILRWPEEKLIERIEKYGLVSIKSNKTSKKRNYHDS